MLEGLARERGLSVRPLTILSAAPCQSTSRHAGGSACAVHAAATHRGVNASLHIRAWVCVCVRYMERVLSCDSLCLCVECG